MSRTPLKNRKLPNYTRGEDIANMVTHIIGGAIGIACLVLAVIIAALHGNAWGVVGGAIYGGCTVVLYCVSSVYHGLRPNTAKKVMQIIDHCTIYFMIAGTYTPILLSSVRVVQPALAWTIFGIEWALVAVAVVFTAIDHNKYARFSMVCYIGMGWCIVIALKATVAAIGKMGFLWLLLGGISYTIGAILYRVGNKRPVFHTVFHIFVDVGTVLQAVCILFYVV